MKISSLKLLSHVLVVMFCLAAVPCKGIIFYATSDPTYNTTAPAGSLTNSGWKYEGQWGSFLGTAISPKHFITAKHVGGTVGAPFIFNGVPYPTLSVTNDPSSDLSIWRVCGNFPTNAPIYTNRDETNKSLVVFGRGTQRAVEVFVTNALGNAVLKGWQWGPYDGVQRWGENQVADIINGDPVFGTIIGDLLTANFDQTGGTNECHLSVGDSGGAVFIRHGSTWKLAGINYAVDGPYNTTNTGDGFNASVFDEGGLYKQTGTTWVLTPDVPLDVPGTFYATRISSHVAWINSVLSGPATPDSQPVLQSASDAAGPYADNTSAVVDDVTKTITISAPGQPQFYRLRACGQLLIRNITLQGGNVVLIYE
jgi:hypothetical protein